LPPSARRAEPVTLLRTSSCGQCAAPLDKPAQPRFAAPESYTPKRLAEKILTSKAALEGERKQVTVLFADLKGSMELLADRDPEEARKLLDPVLEHMMEAVHRFEGTGALRHRHDDVPRDGHAVLAGACGDGDRSVTAKLIDVRAPDRRRPHSRKLRNPLSRSY